MTDRERNRNRYPDSCYVCQRHVSAGEGWIYADTQSRRKRIKCDRCHANKIANKWQADNLDRIQSDTSASPAPKTISIREIQRAVLVPVWVAGRRQDHPAVALQMRNGTQIRVAYMDWLHGTPVPLTAHQIETSERNPRPVSKSAAAYAAEVARYATEVYAGHLSEATSGRVDD